MRHISCENDRLSYSVACLQPNFESNILYSYLEYVFLAGYFPDGIIEYECFGTMQSSQIANRI